MKDCHVSFNAEACSSHFPESTCVQHGENFLTASPHNSNFDKNNTGRVGRCDGLPFLRFCKLVFILYWKEWKLMAALEARKSHSSI